MLGAQGHLRPQMASYSQAAYQQAFASPWQNGATAVTAPAPAAAQPQHSGVTMTIPAGADFHEQAVNQNADGVRLISLGCYCGPKLSFRAMGRDAETLPFDWVRTRIDGLLHFIQNDFDKFFHYDTREVVPGAGLPDKPMVMHRSYFHSFWHDDVTKDADVEKYKRRMERFKAIDASSQPVLFVRSVVSSDELEHTEKLYNDLQQRFGRCSKLLVIVDFQPEDEFVLVNGYENLLVAKLHHRAHAADNNGAPYTLPIGKAIEWAKSGSLPGAVKVPSLGMVKLNPTSWGLQGLGGLDAFERAPTSGSGMAPLPSTGAAPQATAAAATSLPSAAAQRLGAQPGVAQFTGDGRQLPNASMVNRQHMLPANVAGAARQVFPDGVSASRPQMMAPNGRAATDNVMAGTRGFVASTSSGISQNISAGTSYMTSAVPRMAASVPAAANSRFAVPSGYTTSGAVAPGTAPCSQQLRYRRSCN